MKTGTLWRRYGGLHAVILVYSAADVAGKAASRESFLSSGFLLFYGLMLAALGVYALLWQQMLKRIPLTAAVLSKAATIVWGMIAGALLFGEDISRNMVVGAAIIVLGINLVVLKDA